MKRNKNLENAIFKLNFESIESAENFLLNNNYIPFTKKLFTRIFFGLNIFVGVFAIYLFMIIFG